MAKYNFYMPIVLLTSYKYNYQILLKHHYYIHVKDAILNKLINKMPHKY